MSEHLAGVVAELIAIGTPTAVVTVTRARGSTPRGTGTRMLVTPDAIFGTIGGGRLEWEAIAQARAHLGDPAWTGGAVDDLDLPLGPAIGQCCGGHVVLRLVRATADTIAEIADAEARERRTAPQIGVFGAGHVGQALVRALAPLPVRVLWCDTRPDIFGADVPANATTDPGAPVDAVDALAPGAAAVILTHSHALDYAATEAALKRGDLAYVGMIGSRTKRRRFLKWTQARGHTTATEGLTCPIGGHAVPDKRPAVIAALTAAEVLTALATHAAANQPSHEAAQ